MESDKTSKFRTRKKKGALSVLDEFNDEAPGIIVGALNLDSETMRDFEERAKNVDAPVEVRIKSQSSHPSSFAKIEDTLASSGQDELKIPIATHPLASSAFTPNLETIQRQPRENPETTWTKPVDNTEITQVKSGENIDKTWRQTRENLETNQTFSRENLETPSRATFHTVAETPCSPDNGQESYALESKNSPEISDSKPRDNLEKTQIQYRDNLEKTSVEYRDNQVETKVQIGQTQTQPRDIPRDVSRENPETTYRKPRDAVRFATLTGLQRKVVIYVYGETKLARDRVTDSISSNHLAEVCQTTVMNAQNAVKELVKKGALLRAEFKVGRGGWTRYELPNSLFHQITSLENNGKLGLNLETTWRQPGDKPGDKPRELAPSSSSVLNSSDSLKLTTTDEVPTSNQISSQELPIEWQHIDFTELTTQNVPFGLPQLKQWFDRKYCSAERAQESIHHFAFFLKHAKQGAIRTGPLNFFMGIMARDKYFPRPDGYLSHDDRATKQYAEDLKRKSENQKKIQEELFDQVFEIFFDSLTGNQIRSLAPTFSDFSNQKNVIKGLFREQHWLTLKDNPRVDPTTLKLELPIIVETENEQPDLSYENLTKIYQLEAEIAKYQSALDLEKNPALRNSFSEQLRAYRNKRTEELGKLSPENLNKYETTMKELKNRLKQPL